MPKSFSMGHNYLTVLEEFLKKYGQKSLDEFSFQRLLGIPSWVHVSSVALRLASKLTSVQARNAEKARVGELI